ncbi:hypothetical protein [Streptomyces violascens]|uniref:hypothetical protein n=1 Tax=Streptomyces violascens TaxID=67381 RepID=UPI0036471B21
MMKPLYTLESVAAAELGHLGYNAAVDDLVVQAAHTELNRFVANEGEAVQMWGWDPSSLHAADRYRIAQLLRSFVYQEQCIISALRWLDTKYQEYVDSSAGNRAKAEAFLDSLNRAAARRAIDSVVDQVPGAAALTSDKRDRLAQDVVAKWQQKAPGTDAGVSHPELEEFGIKRSKEAVLELGERLVAGVIADSLNPVKSVPGVPQAGKAVTGGSELVGNEIGAEYDPEDDPFLESYLPVPFRRIHALRSVVDFYDPVIAHELGMRSGVFAPRPSAENNRPEDTSFKGSGFDMDLWRLKDQGYPRERIPDGVLYDLVDTALAVQAEYQLQCFFADRELARIIDTRGKDELWLYQTTAQWAVDRARAEAEAKAKASGFWGLVGDILGLVSAVAGVLALIPVLTPIMAPIAIVSAVGSLGAHAAAASISGNWDANTIITLGADALAAIPAVGAIAKGARSAWAGARLNIEANALLTRGGREFVGAIAGKGASDASNFFDRLGKKGVEVVSGTVTQSKIPGKVLQGAVSLATQVPLIVELSSGHTADQRAKDAAAGTALTANIGQTVGEWDTVGAFAKKAGTISLERFSSFFKNFKK